MQMNLRDEIVMQRAVVDQCDKLAVDRRRYGQLSWPTTSRFIAVSVQLCRNKLTTRCDDRRTMHGEIF